MFNVYRDGNNLDVQIKFSVPGLDKPRYLTLSSNRGNEVDAQLMVNRISEEYIKKLEELSKVEYLRGWADAKAKRKKSTWFRYWFKD
jgi:hypothetical protein